MPGIDIAFYTEPSIATRNNVQSSSGDKRFGDSNNKLKVFDQNDSVWAGNPNNKHPDHSYWDYYYTGQDVKVYIDGTEEDSNYSDLPIVEFAFNVTQQKQPVFGFWSYNYDAVMRGNRIVNGAFSIATRHPNYMKGALATAAESRSKLKSSYKNARELTEDDRKINKYWGTVLDATSDQENLFVVHPPFSFVVVYGIQQYSVDRARYANAFRGREFDEDQALFLDTNHRLVEPDTLNYKNRIVLEACELTDVQRSIGPDGQVLIETYSFFARDMVVPAPGGGTVAQTSNTYKPTYDTIESSVTPTSLLEGNNWSLLEDGSPLDVNR